MTPSTSHPHPTCFTSFSSRSEAAIRLLGKEWIDRHRRIMQQHASSYQRAAWAKVLGYLSAQGLGGDLGSLGKTAIKDRWQDHTLSSFSIYHSLVLSIFVACNPLSNEIFIDMVCDGDDIFHSFDNRNILSLHSGENLSPLSMITSDH